MSLGVKYTQKNAKKSSSLVDQSLYMHIIHIPLYNFIPILSQPCTAMIVYS